MRRRARVAGGWLRPSALGLACAIAWTTPHAIAQPFARPIGDQRLEALSGNYFDELWKLDPPRATRAGVHTYDDRLGSYDATAFASRLDFAKRTLHNLQAIDPQTMGADASYDERILEASLESSILTLGSIAPWQHRPAYYTEVASGAVYSLLARDFAPLPDRVRSLVAREHQMPALFDAARTNLTSVDATTGALDRREIVGSIDFFTNVVPAAVAPLKDGALRAQFATVNGDVIASIKAYLAALDAGVFAHPSGTFAIGADRFARLLEYQELTPIALTTYERVGEDALARTRAQFVETAKSIDPTQTPQHLVDALSAQHPTAARLLPKAASDLASLRSFVVSKDLITLPPDNDVKVVATPEFARETTFASINVPGPLETAPSAAFYNVTPVDPAWNAERQDQHLSFFNDAYFPLVSAHEVMPGHYVNFALARHEKLSLIRELLPSPSFSEGWAHYVEQMMVDSGWGNGDPHVRLAQLQGALQRECRYLVGLREHTQGMSIDDATKFFESNAFMAPETARREALRGTVDPLYGYYTLGKLELLKLRDDYRKSAGSSYKLKTFHDLLLSRGDPPIAIARKIVLGSEDDGKLL
jgi:uncharacterized protein (DUF885 family)